jgi:DMSO/TMAO reductase YedYZ molybdopterin-dependent catalytic subunit
MKPRSPPFVSQVTTERRTVLRWLGGSAVLALGGDVLSACLGEARTRPGGRDASTGDAVPEAETKTTFPFQPGPRESDLYDDWFENTVDPQNVAAILASWKLTVDGMVEHPVVLSFADLIGLPRQDQATDFHCVEGWSVYDVPWNGVAPARLLDLVGVDAAATHLTFHSIGGRYVESLPIEVAREPRTLLGYGVGGSTLPIEHGVPVRLVVPRLLGYKNAKYLERIELTDHAETGYWEQYGYPYEGEGPSGRLRPGKY